MDARYALIRAGHEQAEQVTDAARDDVARYEAQLATIRAEAQQRIEAARTTLDAERAERLAEVNARIAEKRAAAATEVEQARMAAQADVESAVRSVAARAGELATGRTPRPERRRRRRRRRDERRSEPMIAFLTEVLVGVGGERRRSTTRATSRRTRGSGPSRPS